MLYPEGWQASHCEISRRIITTMSRNKTPIVAAAERARPAALKTSAWLASLLAVLAFMPPVAAAAGTFEATERGCLWRQGDAYVRFERGKWSAGLAGQAEFSWQMFFWHDDWVYETLPGGQVQAQPALEPDGSLTMRGIFSAQAGSPPVKYAYRISPGAESLQVRCELQKSAALKLTRGIWLHVVGSRDKLQGSERVWFAPAAYGTVSAAPSATADRVWLELHQGRSLCLGLPSYRLVENEGGKRAHVFRIQLRPEDFEPGETAVLQYTISFGQMPDRFPGQIEPAREPLAITAVSPQTAAVGQYEPLELRVEAGATYDNPFDPDDVRLDAVFTSPSGRQRTVPGFFMVDYRPEVADGAEVMIPQPESGWRVRFTPQEIGLHRWQLRLRDRSGEVSGGEGSLECRPGPGRGFVRTSQADPHYLAFDNGEGFFAIGHNLPIYHTTGQRGDQAMRKFAAAGENFNRWWMSSAGFGIEWTDRLGWYRQDVAARIDRSLELAAELGLYYMLCLDTHQDFRETGWERNPFNAKNGGPCETPRDWFTNQAARQYYQKRLRYIVARWGYSPQVLCWEFGNEMEGWDGASDEVKFPWHKEMSDHLRASDPFGHLITTSFWSKTGPEQYWDLPNIDIVQTHCYTNDDGNVAEAVRGYCLHQWERFPKPHIFGEFGIRSHASTADKDPQGWAIHNSLWAGLTSFAAGGPMPWWHENYIEPLDLYFHFTSLQRFAGDLPLGTVRWTKLETTPPAFVDSGRTPETRDVVILPASRWGKPEHAEFTLLRDGTIADQRLPQQLLHGQSHRDLKSPPTFIVTYPQPGKFAVRVGRVSAAGLLKVWIDGELQLERELPCGEGLGKASAYQPQWKLWETTYDEDVAMDVPAGTHRIRIENEGRDWVTVSSYRFTGCQVLDKPNVLVAGMKCDRLGVLWIQNRDSTWYNHARDAVPGVDAFRLRIEGLRNGWFEVECWETWKGERVRTEQVEVRDGRLTLTVPDLATDRAWKIQAKSGGDS